MVVSVFSEFLASLSALLALAVIFGAAQRNVARKTVSCVALGAVFGGVAVLEMQFSQILADSVLIDMRNIPIALAGAFLGRPGLAICVGLAMSYRIHLGGISAAADVLSMLIAGGMGHLWHHLTKRDIPRGVLPMGLLGAMMSTHILGAMVLPAQPYYSFFRDAAGPIVTLNMLIVPTLAFIFDRQHSRHQMEARLETLHTNTAAEVRRLVSRRFGTSTARRVRTSQTDRLFDTAAFLMTSRTT